MTAFTRTLILYFLIMLGLRLMGKRQIAELEPSELVLTMMISDLAAVPMQDFGIPLLAGIIPILTLMALSLLLSHLSLQNLKFRELVCGTPSILIRNGKLQQESMRKNRYTLDELLEELRGQGFLKVQDVNALHQLFLPRLHVPSPFLLSYHKFHSGFCQQKKTHFQRRAPFF